MYCKYTYWFTDAKGTSQINNNNQSKIYHQPYICMNILPLQFVHHQGCCLPVQVQSDQDFTCLNNDGGDGLMRHLKKTYGEHLGNMLSILVNNNMTFLVFRSMCSPTSMFNPTTPKRRGGDKMTPPSHFYIIDHISINLVQVYKLSMDMYYYVFHVTKLVTIAAMTTIANMFMFHYM